MFMKNLFNIPLDALACSLTPDLSTYKASATAPNPVYDKLLQTLNYFEYGVTPGQN